MQQQMYLEVPLIRIPLGHAVSMAACGGVATRGLMPGIRIHEIYAVGSIAAAEASFLGSSFSVLNFGSCPIYHVI